MAEQETPYQQQLDEWLSRLKRIDHLLDGPARSLIWMYRQAARQRSAGRPRRMPQWISSDRMSRRDSILVHAAACNTIQRILSKSWRYQWLGEKEADIVELLASIEEDYTASSENADPFTTTKSYDDYIFGSLNPLTSAEILWVLIKSGERSAHAGTGFLMVFNLLWSLRRRFNPTRTLPIAEGARLDPHRSSAFVTMRALIPIRTLCEIMQQRAKLYRSIGTTLHKASVTSEGTSVRQRWQFAMALERLCNLLHELGPLSINGADFVALSDVISSLAGGIGTDTGTEAIWRDVRAGFGDLLAKLGRKNREALKDARRGYENVIRPLIALLPDKTQRERLNKACTFIQADHVRDDQLDDYWKDLHDAAKQAGNTVRTSIKTLFSGAQAAARLGTGKSAPSIGAITEVLEKLRKANESVAKDLHEKVRENVAWMRSTMTRQIAFASSGNSSSFDPSELLAATNVSERWLRIPEIEVRDALIRVSDAARNDGSWAAVQPIYLVKGVLGSWPGTVDTMWLLASAVKDARKVEEADRALFHAVTWLEKNLNEITHEEEGERVKLSGWPSETPEGDRIDTWVTASAINTLIEVREVIEQRLWQICQRRFVIRREVDLKSLDEIDPVDLGAVHEHRLHRRLIRMARETGRQDTLLEPLPGRPRPRPEKRTEYALILHGPPGSSKTAIAEGLGNEMWRSLGDERRFIRITPADFTRGGEASIDAEARFIFDLLTHIRGVTIFFDEIDDLLRLRTLKTEVSFIKLIVPAMLNRLQDLRDASPRQDLCFLIATNFIDNIEPALTRPGRIDASIPVPYPDALSRESILERVSGKRKIKTSLTEHVVARTAGWPWSTFNRLCKVLRDSESLAVTSVDEHIHHLSTEFESSEYYYFDEERWKSYSRPLLNEFIHGAFSASSRREDCQIAVQKLTNYLLEQKFANLSRLPFLERFKSEWKREGRG